MKLLWSMGWVMSMRSYWGGVGWGVGGWGGGGVEGECRGGRPGGVGPLQAALRPLRPRLRLCASPPAHAPQQQRLHRTPPEKRATHPGVGGVVLGPLLVPPVVVLRVPDVLELQVDRRPPHRLGQVHTLLRSVGGGGGGRGGSGGGGWGGGGRPPHRLGQVHALLRLVGWWFGWEGVEGRNAAAHARLHPSPLLPRGPPFLLAPHKQAPPRPPHRPERVADVQSGKLAGEGREAAGRRKAGAAGGGGGAQHHPARLASLAAAA
jgi:hypothetical protein